MKKLLFLFPALFCLTCSQAFQSESAGPDFSGSTLPEMSITEDGNLTLAKSGLEKEYLLQASFIDVSGAGLTSPSFRGTQSRIIYFKEQNHSLFLMESNKGLFSSEEIPAEWILAQFKIISEDENRLIFDFNEGMKNIFVGSDWYASDFDRGRAPTIAVSAPNSFLKEVKRENNRIMIRQTAQLQIGAVFLMPVEVVYYLENYNPDPDFQPVENIGFDRLGFFEANPVVRQEFGDYKTFISRWNLKKPIVYSLSDNTPKEFVDAIKEGVLYWNKVFGADVVQVQTAPADRTAPDSDLNIIQWVTNHYAGFAYADAQMDPRTGEILHAQIYLTSTFSAPVVSEIGEMEKTDRLTLGLKGFTNGLLCEYPLNETPAGLGAPQKLTADFVRDVVAHEVGHTLGLRHNFAASTGSEMTPAEISKIFDDALKGNDVLLNKPVASSVMDYLVTKEAILNGKYIGAAGDGPLAYDQMAIGWGYYGEKPTALFEKTLYCADSLLRDGYDDCNVFDGASHPLLASLKSFEERAEKLPNLIARIFLSAKTNFDPRLRKTVGNVPLPAEILANHIISPLANTFGLLKEKARSLLVERMAGPATDVNKKEIFNATNRWLDKAIRNGRGLKEILPSIAEPSFLYGELNGAYEKFSEIIGGLSEFSDQEKAIIKRRAKPFFEMVADKVIRAVTAILAGPMETDGPATKSSFRPIQAISDLEDILGTWAEFIITDNAEVSPTFADDLRLLAVNILLPGQGPTENWEKENRAKVLGILLEKLRQRYGESLNGLPETEAAIIQMLSGEGS